MIVASLAVSAVMAPVALIPQPHNWIPCPSGTSRHCTFSSQDRPGGVNSWWRGDSKTKHPITNRRARTREVNGFHYFNWIFDGKVDGHAGCWDNYVVLRCYGGYWKRLS